MSHILRTVLAALRPQSWYASRNRPAAATNYPLPKFSAWLLFLALLIPVTTTSAQDAGESSANSPKNVILFIADGLGPAQVTMARDYKRDFLKGGATLAVDEIQTGAVRTNSTSGRITDSAAGATAFACGIKTYNGAIAVDTLKQPCATLLEAAEARGMATGLVATSRITHATPASFASHVPERWQEDEIASQMLTQGIDVILGGGRRHFLPEEEGGRRKDGRNLMEEAREAGYNIVSSEAELANLDDDSGDGLAQNLNEGAVLGLFTMNHLPFEVDAEAAEQPSLAEMTRAALEVLDEDQDGFFLLVEGSRIDHAGHSNDAAGILHDVLAFDEAVAAALEFADEGDETLIVATSDHETGGMSLARGGEYRWYPDSLAQVSGSVDRITTLISRNPERAGAVMRRLGGVEDLTPAQQERFEEAGSEWRQIRPVVVDILSRRARIGWTTTGHTAVDVPLYAFGPGARYFHGNVDNTYVGDALATLMSFDLERETRRVRSERAQEHQSD